MALRYDVGEISQIQKLAKEDINPAQTDLNFAIQMKDRKFIGRAAILAARKDDSLRLRCGLELEGRRAARENCQVYHGEQIVGVNYRPFVIR